MSLGFKSQAGEWTDARCQRDILQPGCLPSSARSHILHLWEWDGLESHPTLKDCSCGEGARGKASSLPYALMQDVN